MSEAHDPESHWMLRERRTARGRPRSGPWTALAAWCGRGFLLFASAAIGYGLWGLYGSGAHLRTFDATQPMECPTESSTGERLEPARLEPGMAPLRAVLHATYAPLGSRRLRYEVALEDAAGAELWRASGSLGTRHDEASVVMRRASLAVFEVPRAGEHRLRVRTFGASMDNLREARLELRRNVLRVDARIPWSLGLAAFACLALNQFARHRGGRVGSPPNTGDSHRAA